jgi:hypothetical protein
MAELATDTSRTFSSTPSLYDASARFRAMTSSLPG